MKIRSQLLATFLPLTLVSVGLVGVMAIAGTGRLRQEAGGIVERVFGLHAAAGRSVSRLLDITEAKVRDDHRFLARQIARSLDLTHDFLRKDADAIGASTLIESFLTVPPGGRDFLRQQIETRFHWAMRLHGFDTIALVDIEGRPLLYMDETPEVGEGARQTAFLRWLQTRAARFGAVPATELIGADEGADASSLLMVVPLRYRDNRFDPEQGVAAGFLVLRLQVQRLCRAVLHSDEPGEARVTVADRRGALLHGAEPGGAPAILVEEPAVDGLLTVRVAGTRAQIERDAQDLKSLLETFRQQSARIEGLARAVEAGVAEFRYRFVAATIVALLLVGTVGLFLAGRMTAPLTRLAGAAHRISEGRLDEQPETEGDDEIGMLGRSLEQMRHSLKDHIENLDRKVGEKSAALAERERYFRAVFDQSGVGIVLATREGVIVESNAAFQEMLQYGAQELRGKAVREISHPDDWDEEVRRIGEFVNDGRAQGQLQKRYVRKDGEHVWVDLAVSPLRDEKGEASLMVGVAYNITQQRRTEETMRANERAYRLLFTEMADGFGLHEIVLDAGGRPCDYRFLDVNPAFERMTGLRADAIIGRTIREVAPEIEPFWIETYGDVALTGRPQYFERYSPIFERHYSVTAYSPQKGRFVTIFSDVTQRKNEEDQRARLQDQMQQVQKLESLGVLAGGIAHDFNNLLMAVLGNADLALADLPSSSPAKVNLEDIVKAATRAADLCGQMLAYSGKGRFRIEQVDLNDVIRDMGHLLEVSIRKNAVLDYEMAGGLPSIEVDVTQIRQIVMNLITNASEAIGARAGRIHLRTGIEECGPDGPARNYTGERLPGGAYVFLEVADSGCGMSSETLARIFDPFFTTKFTGRGLGLAAVLGIVRGHRGAIRVSSETGKGSTFRVLLPAAGPKEGVALAEPPSDASWRSTGTVLLVDDEAEVRSVAGRMLASLGLEVVVAPGGHEALEILQADPSRISCVLLDLTMPRMDGEECFRRLRAIRPDLPIVLTSGYSEQDAVGHFAGKGLSGFIQKPYIRARLVTALRTVLE